jgi:uncharacterized protein with HEPN domain
MQRKSPKLLEDIRASAEFLRTVTHGKTLSDYQTDALLRAAVERHFEIIGEAMNRLAKLDPVTVARINDYPRIIAFRNILIHGYDLVDHAQVWHVLQNYVPILEHQAADLLNDADPP